MFSIRKPSTTIDSDFFIVRFKIQQNVIIRPTLTEKEGNINIPSRSSEQGAIAFKAFLIKKVSKIKLTSRGECQACYYERNK